MKPSTLTQPQSALFGLIATLLIGCAGGTPQVIGDDDDQPPPPMIKEPPMPKDNSTAAGCDGVTASGTCDDGVALTCDVEAGELRRKDCKALGKTCVVDAQTGAKCEAVGSGGGGGTGGDCGNGVTNEGSCGGTGGQTATWCDSFSGQTIVWDCAAENKMCRTDCQTASGTAIPGAFCCGEGGAPPVASNECPALGFEGECTANGMARWCNGDELVEVNCTMQGKECVDDPTVGAICRTPVASECETLGFEGRCVGGKPRWCQSGEVMEVTCGVGTQCEENGPDCAPGGGDAGAYCCAP